VTDHDHVLEVPVVTKALELLEQGLVDDDRLVFGVGGHEAELVGMQAGVDRVQDRAHGRDGEVELEVLGLVPQHGGHAVTAADAELGQGAGQPPRAGDRLAHRRAVHRAVGAPEDHLALAAQLLGSLDDRRERELVVVHHRAG
jgi:hypothetical protein